MRAGTRGRWRRPSGARWGRAGEAWEIFGTWSGEAGVPTSPTRWPTAAGVATRPRGKIGRGARRAAASRAASSRFDEDDVFWFNKNCAEIDE